MKRWRQSTGLVFRERVMYIEEALLAALIF
jgi:hypothetical protein